MACELILTFKNQNGDWRRVVVSGERFAIGRTAENDLPIANDSISRRHVEIHRFGDVFVLNDLNSGGGTILNREIVNQAIALKNGDRLTLGGVVEIEIEIAGNEAEYFQTLSAFSSEN